MIFGYDFGQAADTRETLIERLNAAKSRASTASPTGIRDNLIARLDALLEQVADAEEDALVELEREIGREEGKVELLFGPPTSPPASDPRLEPSEKKRNWTPILMVGALGVVGWIFYRTLRQPKTSLAYARPTDPRQMRIGMRVEREHTNDSAVAASIACDHIREVPDYYDRLLEMESEALS